MQRNIKYKVTFFTFGLLAGVTIGVVFAVTIKEVLGHFNDLRTGIVNLGSKEDKISQRLDSLEDKMSTKDKKPEVVIVNKTAATSPQLAIANNTKAAVDSNSPTAAVDGKDSIAIVADTTSNESPDVVVMTNQLVNVSNVTLTDFDSAQTKKSAAAKHSDSLIASMNGTEQVTPITNYRVEFWESPINFRGYKMSLGKIILYGVSTKTPVKLVKWEDSYYLVTNQMLYRMEYTDDLKSFDKVTDKTTLKKFSL